MRSLEPPRGQPPPRRRDFLLPGMTNATWSGARAERRYQCPSLRQAPLDGAVHLRSSAPAASRSYVKSLPETEWATISYASSAAERTSRVPSVLPQGRPSSAAPPRSARVSHAVNTPSLARHDSTWVASERALDIAAASWPVRLWLRNDGRAIAARMPMITTTTNTRLARTQPHRATASSSAVGARTNLGCGREAASTSRRKRRLLSTEIIDTS